MNGREYLFHLERFGIKLGLENITRLMQRFDNPHDRFRSVHVAGTNGKGSVLAMLDAILRAAGYTTGRYTSPHLIALNERFLHNGSPVSDDVLDEQIATVRAAAETMDPPPTFFEFVTAVGFRWLADLEVDVGLIEVGMGGRFDATNVLHPLVSGITNIDLEHTRYLGDTLEKIAFEKAGIIKPGVPVVVTETKPGPRDVILSRARELDCPTVLLGRDFEYRLEGDAFHQQFEYHGKQLEISPVELGLAGGYQGENAAAAVALAEQIRAIFPRIDGAAIQHGLSVARWPCRLEKVLDHPPVIIDVAHNAAGAAKLARQLDACVLLLAVSSDKAADKMIEILAPAARELILTQFSGPRALPVDRLCEAAGDQPHLRVDSLEKALELGIEKASDTAPLVVTGSIFLAGEARALLIERHGARPLRF